MSSYNNEDVHNNKCISVEPIKSDSRLIDRAVCLWEAINAITERGNNAEVKRKKDGSFTVYEVKKNIVTV